jgi:hypothetical protein
MYTEATTNSCPILESFYAACAEKQYAWAAPDIHAMSMRYLNESITVERAMSKARAAESEYLQPNLTAAVRTRRRRLYLHALARWWAAIQRAQEHTAAPDFKPPEVGDAFAPMTTKASVVLSNRARRAARAQAHVDLLTNNLKTVLTEYAEAKAAHSAALLARREAQWRWERELMEARKENPSAMGPRWARSNLDAAVDAVRVAREKRKLLQLDVRKRKQEINSWSQRRERILDGRYPLAWERNA